MAKKKKTEEIVEPVVQEVAEDFMPEPEEEVKEEIEVKEEKVEEIKQPEQPKEEKQPRRAIVFTPVGPKVEYR